MSERPTGPGGDRTGAPGSASVPNAQQRPPDMPAADGGRPDGAGPARGGSGISGGPGGSGPGEETTTVHLGGADRPGGQQPAPHAAPPVTPPPWQRVSQSSGEPAATTEVYRPGVATAVASHTTVVEPLPKLPDTSGPGHLPGSPPGGLPPQFSPPGPASAPGGLGGPGNGQLPNPFGGSGPVDAMGQHGNPAQNPAHRPPPGRPTARPTAPVRGRVPRAPRKASLQIRRFDPWSVLKLSLVLSVAMFLMWLVAVGVLYGVLNGMGVWDKLNGAWNDLSSVNAAGGDSEPLISAGRIFGISAVVGAVNIVLVTAFATVSAFIYNVSADLAGGIEVTLSERD